MVESFPELNENQFALSMAEVTTGIIVDETFKYATSADQKVYSIYENLPDALNTAKFIIESNANIECYIHRKGNLFVQMINRDNVSAIE